MIQRRALMLALVAVLMTASGAMTWAADSRLAKTKLTRVNDGYVSVLVTLQPGTIDTANFLNGAATTVNDSLIFYSEPFSVPTAWTICKSRLFYETVDTTSTIDTIGYQIESKFASPYDSTWWKIGGVTKAEEDVINTTPLSMTARTYDADSIGIGDYFRVKFAIIAEEAEWRAVDTSSTLDGLLPLNAKYHLYMVFTNKGNR